MKHITLTVLATLFAGQSAFAGPNCTDQPKSEWMSEDDMKKQILDAGYKIKKFKTTDGNCYEIYGYDTEKRRVEIYYHPVTGEIVKQEID